MTVARGISVGTKVATSIAPPLTDGGSPYVFSITDGDIPLPAEYSNVMNIMGITSPRIRYALLEVRLRLR